MTREEAIEVYNGLLNQKIKEAFEFFAPELREDEDEDEKIRKKLVALVSEEINIYDVTDYEQKQMLAWLKKQKENIEKEYVFRPLAGTDITIAAEQAIRRANEGDRLVLAFNGAYIPVRKGCNANKIVDIYNAFIEKQKGPENTSASTMIPSCWETEQKEQKSERINITEMVAKYRATDEYIEGEYKGKPINCMIRAYEQGIRDTLLKVKEQRPVEWSEEDERMRQTAIESCKTTANDYENSNSRFYKCMNWLKSLRPLQYCEKCKLKKSVQCWKPSEEQMEALKNAQDILVSDLNSLYNDLKKLM